MTENLPDYSTIKPPDGKPKPEFDHHERRADLLRRVISAGSPYAINQSNLAADYDVDPATVCRDMKRLRESISDALGDDAKLTARAIFERTLLDLSQADDWRASKAAFDAVMDWNEWLADIGEQHREPRRSELGVDVRSRSVDVSYQVVREGDSEELPTSGTDAAGEDIDYEALGFTSGPAEIEVETSESEQP